MELSELLMSDEKIDELIPLVGGVILWHGFMENEVGYLIRAIDSPVSELAPIEDGDSETSKAKKMLAQYPHKENRIDDLGEKLKISIASYGEINDSLGKEVLSLWDTASGYFELRRLCAHGHWYQPFRDQVEGTDFNIDEAFGVISPKTANNWYSKLSKGAMPDARYPIGCVTSKIALSNAATAFRELGRSASAAAYFVKHEKRIS